ncbi:uncharacterized protein LOC101888354 [Musca domestica]|uniref:Gap junction alpha-1 protein n=1 Tax=Musca domestica TaxID=7370 RepID=T1PAF7_MUSDO|nr:uncharacterized protein LOC101888354 [Musca domestica]
MDKLKVKVIGVLKERESKVNYTNDTGLKIAATTIPSQRQQLQQQHQQPIRMSALDISGILNCRRRMEWTKEWLKKYQHEFLNKENLRKDLLFRSNEVYHINHFFSITEKQFRHLVNILEPLVMVLEPHRRKKPFSAEERIAITLKYLATGEVNSCRNYCFRASKPVIIKMIADICEKIYELLKDEYVSLPKTDEEWINVIGGMQKSQQISNCLGHLIMRQVVFHAANHQPAKPRAILWDDGEDKSCSRQPPLILTAIVDGNYNFLHLDVEKTKAKFYDEIFENSKIRTLIEENTMLIPAVVKDVNGSCRSYSFASSYSLPEKHYLKAISELEFSAINNTETNDALCMLTNMFPVLGQPLRLGETEAQKIILGSVALYNYLRKTNQEYCKLTERIVVGSSIKVNTNEDDVDDECILIEQDEFSPNVSDSTCFKTLRKQRGDIPAGLEW